MQKQDNMKQLEAPSNPPEMVVVGQIIIQYRERRGDWSKATTAQFDDEPAGWKVSIADRYAAGLTWDEMLGLVASLTVGENKPCQHWLQTREGHKAWRESLTSKEEGRP